MFPFHTLVLTSWLIVVGPYLVPSELSQECLTFLTTAIWNASADCQTVEFAIFCELYCNPPYTHFTMPNPLWLISWAKPWLMCRWWATLSTVAQWLTRIMTRTRSIFLSVLHVEGHPVSGETCATVFKHGKPFIYTNSWLVDKALYPVQLSVYDYFLPLVKLWPTEIFITTHCSSLVQMDSDATTLTLLCQYYSCPSRSKLLHSNPEGSCLYQQAQWAVNPKQQNLKKTSFWILSDSATYTMLRAHSTHLLQLLLYLPPTTPERTASISGLKHPWNWASKCKYYWTALILSFWVNPSFSFLEKKKKIVVKLTEATNH